MTPNDFGAGSGGVPERPYSWTIARMGNHGITITCDNIQIRLAYANVEKFYDLIIDEEVGLVQTEDGFWVNVDADSEDGDIILLPVSGDDTISKLYPNGILIDGELLKVLGVELEDFEEDFDDPEPTHQPVPEGVKMAYKRSGNKLKRGFRVTSGIRKGRVVANIKTAHKPRAKASLRMKLRLARKKKRVIRIMKSKRTKRKSLSKRLVRMNKR